MIRILDSSFVLSATEPGHYPPERNPEIAFVGRSNVGKSSMINTLLNRRKIARISTTPGKTRLVNFIRVRLRREEPDTADKVLHFVDLPGYGYAKVSDKERDSWRKMILSYLQGNPHLLGIAVLIDIRHPVDPKDRMMLDLVFSLHLPFLVVATKADKITKNALRKTTGDLAKTLTIPGELVTPFSSLHKSGIEPILAWIGRLCEE